MKNELIKPDSENYRDKMAKNLLSLRHQRKNKEAREIMADIRNTQTYTQAKAAYVYERDTLSKLDDDFLAAFDRFASQECHDFYIKVLKARRKYAPESHLQPLQPLDVISR